MASSFINSVEPGISFSGKRREIFVYHSTIEDLGYPNFIRFLMNVDKGCIAIQRCERKELESFVVPEYANGEWNFRICSENMIRIIWQRFGWQNGLTYRCFGTLRPEFHLVEFDLRRVELVSEAEQETATGK